MSMPRGARRTPAGTEAGAPAVDAPAGPAAGPVPAHPAHWLPGSVVAENVRLVQRDSVAVGIVNASTPFLPVLLLRLGGTTFQVSLLTAIPAVAGFLFAIPVGRFLQGRRSVVPWYSSARLVAQLGFGVMAVAMLVLPQGSGWPSGAAPAALAVLAIWALQTPPNTLVNVAFPVVDGWRVAAHPVGSTCSAGGGRSWA